MDSTIWWLMGYLIGGVVFGYVTDHLAKSKGYESGFAWGFWLGFVGLLVVGFRPVKAAEEKSIAPVFEFLPASGSAIVDPNGGAIPMYEKPDRDVLSWVPSTTRLSIMEMDAERNWVKVWYNGESGYVKKAELQNLELEEMPAKAEKAEKRQEIPYEQEAEQDIADKLRLLAKLHAEGLLTDEEFSRKKAEIIANI